MKSVVLEDDHKYRAIPCETVHTFVVIVDWKCFEMPLRQLLMNLKITPFVRLDMRLQ